MTKRVMRVPTPSPPHVTRGGFALSDSEKDEAFADNLEGVSAGDRSFGPGSYWDGWRGAEVFLKPCQRTPFNHPWRGSRSHQGLKVSKAPGPNGISNRALKHLPKRGVSLHGRIFNAVLRTHHFPQTRKHARVIPILKPRKDPALPLPIGPLVSWTRLVHYLRRSY